MDSPTRSTCCLWQPLKKKKSDEQKNSVSYYGDWGIDENINAVNSIFPKKKQGTLRKDEKKEIKKSKK